MSKSESNATGRSRSTFNGWLCTSLMTCIGLVGTPICAVASAQSVRDSAGIRIVMNEKPMWTAAQTLKLSATPTLEFGGKAGDPQKFKSIRGAFYLSDGRIVVGERLAVELRVFDSTGKFLRTIGKKGEGPGEFKTFGSVVRLAGDTIAVFHDETAISRFHSSGTFIARDTIAGLKFESNRPVSHTSTIVALNGGSRVNVTMPFEVPVGPDGSRMDAKGFVEVVRSDGSSTKKPGELALMRARVEKQHLSQLWLGAEAVFTGNGSQFVFGFPAAYSITRYSAEGVPNLIVRRSWTPTAVTSQDWSDWTDEWLKRWTKSTGAQLAKEREELFNDDYAEDLPAYSAALIDRLGRLWLRAPKTIDGAVAGSLKDYPIGPSTWSVFSNTGIWLGDVVMPTKFEPTDIGADYVLGIARVDETNPAIVRYKLSNK